MTIIFALRCVYLSGVHDKGSKKLFNGKQPPGKFLLAGGLLSIILITLGHSLIL